MRAGHHVSAAARERDRGLIYDKKKGDPISRAAFNVFLDYLPPQQAPPQHPPSPPATAAEGVSSLMS
jgi:hypothetical protein